jgi:hypothetical protein
VRFRVYFTKLVPTFQLVFCRGEDAVGGCWKKERAPTHNFYCSFYSILAGTMSNPIDDSSTKRSNPLAKHYKLDSEVQLRSRPFRVPLGGPSSNRGSEASWVPIHPAIDYHCPLNWQTTRHRFLSVLEVALARGICERVPALRPMTLLLAEAAGSFNT